MKSHIMSMAAASVLLASLACGCVAETGTDQGTSTGEKASKTEQLGTEQSAVVYGNPPGYNPPGYNPPGYNPATGNPPGYNPPGTGYGGAANPPGYNPPGYNPATGNPPGYNPPGTGY